MTERLRAIPARLLEWWNRFTSKQKTIIICITAGVVIALAILVTVLTRPCFLSYQVRYHWFYVEVFD